MQNVLSLIKGFLGEMGGGLAPEATVEEDRYHLLSAKPRPAGGEFYQVPDRPSRAMALQLFQTGRSRTYLVGQISVNGDVRPVHYASVASVILQREDGQFTPYTRPLKADLILIDLDGLESSEVVERYREGIEIIHSRPSEPGYKGRRIAAIRESARVQREMQEEGLLACSEGREQGVLVAIDGSLAEIEGASGTPGLVGLVPAVAEVLGDTSEVLACPFNARSALDTRDKPPCFYLRVRENAGFNPDFGLIRIELGTQPDGSQADEAWASDVACILMLERFPVDPHSQGWDKTIFALQHAGKYIDTLIPPPKMVTTYFGRSTA